MKIMSIPRAAKDPSCPFREYRLRELLKAGRLDGCTFRAGRRTYVDLDRLEAVAEELIREEGGKHDAV